MKKTLKKYVVWCLTILARLTLKKYKPVVIAVTGSVGKTSAKDAIFAVLKEVVPSIRKSDKSFNSELGVPLTVLGCPNAWNSFSGWVNNIFHGLSLVLLPHEYPKYIVVEAGADHPGDIKNVAKWLAPKVSVLTKISALPVHVEFFKSREQLFNEKMELAKALNGVKDSVLVTYGDTEEMANLKHPGADLKENENRVHTIVYGTEADCKGKCDVLAKEYDYEQVDGKVTGIKFKLQSGNSTYDLKLHGVLGITHVYPYLVAGAVLKALNLSIDQDKFQDALKDYSPKGRMCILKGKNESTLLDDTYNSSPDAVESALKELAGAGQVVQIDQTEQAVQTGQIGQRNQRKIAILGDMMELGNQSIQAHENIGKLCANLTIDVLITSGVRAEKIADSALKAGMNKDSVFKYSNSVKIADEINSGGKLFTPQTGDIILIKGSQSARMERVTFALLDESQRAKAGELLVRQEEEWTKR